MYTHNLYDDICIYRMYIYIYTCMYDNAYMHMYIYTSYVIYTYSARCPFRAFHRRREPRPKPGQPKGLGAGQLVTTRSVAVTQVPELWEDPKNGAPFYSYGVVWYGMVLCTADPTVLDSTIPMV